MKLIQQWLGYSNISTTANIYSHVDAASTFQCAMVIDETLGKGENQRIIFSFIMKG